MSLEISCKRPVGHITDLIRRLEMWRGKRVEISGDPARIGKRLRTVELDEAIAYLEEYRELMAKGVS